MALSFTYSLLASSRLFSKSQYKGFLSYPTNCLAGTARNADLASISKWKITNKRQKKASVIVAVVNFPEDYADVLEQIYLDFFDFVFGSMALAPVLGTTQDAPRPDTWTYELTEEDETDMRVAIDHFSGRTLVGRLVGTTPSRPTVREWIESALGGSTACILELSMMGADFFFCSSRTLISTDALLA
ncbi:hypothetical protein L7F22_009971 [Adiantum nelumboides]|nr:hypothetical protein [Adiantum nelumboides]